MDPANLDPASSSHLASREDWDAIADRYDAHVAPGEAALATLALRLAGLRSGQRFLDVAAGTGGLGLPAARMGARVVATDWSPRMIERLEARVRDEGLADVEGRVMDCHDLAFDDGAFDVTGSLFGVMLVPDQPRALREMVRVTRSGGRVLVVSYGAPAAFEALRLFVGALAEVDPAFTGLPDDPPPLEFQVSDPDVLRDRLVDAGLHDVTVDGSHEERIEVGSGKALWNWCLSGNPIPSMLVSDLSEDDRARMLAALDRVLRARTDGEGPAVLTAPVNIGIGTR